MRPSLSIYLFIPYLLNDVANITVYITSNNLIIANSKLVGHGGK
jgi:hypothetical protein